MRSSAGHSGLKTLFNTNQLISLIVVGVFLLDVVNTKVRKLDLYRKIEEKFRINTQNEIQCKNSDSISADLDELNW